VGRNSLKWGEGVFFGEYDHTMDTKGRVSMPAKFREKLSGTFYITQGLDTCLFVFPEDEWQKIVTKLKDLPLTNKDARNFVRKFFSGAMEATFDKQGRVMISPKLREYANFEKEITVIGVSSRIELWSNEVWENYNNDEGLTYEELAEQMSELGI
jgi:MraZ protein